MVNKSPLHHKYASLLSSESQEKLAEVKSRKISAASIISTSSDVSEFLDFKIKDAKLDMDYTERYKRGLVEAYERDTIEEEDLTEALHDIKQDDMKIRREYVALKRQRKLIQDDIKEGDQSNLEKAYALAMLNRVKIPPQLSQSARNPKKPTQDDFRQALESYYGAARTMIAGDSQIKQVFCAVTKRWWLSGEVKAAHMVPKSLQSDELSYLFGAGEMDLSEPRNGLLLHRKIEEALDRGAAVIVPLPSKDFSTSEWKLLLTTESLRNQVAVALPFTASDQIYWRDLDETILQFPNENRPARRYLYFKYLMTFLMTQELGGTKWAEKRAHKGSMWCTPGPYLRKSMLASLAKQVSDGWLPEAIYTGATFSDAAEEPNRPPDNEEVLAMSLGLKLEEEKTDASKRALAADNPDDEADDEEES